MFVRNGLFTASDSMLRIGCRVVVIGFSLAVEAAPTQAGIGGMEVPSSRLTARSPRTGSLFPRATGSGRLDASQRPAGMRGRPHWVTSRWSHPANRGVVVASRHDAGGRAFTWSASHKTHVRPSLGY